VGASFARAAAEEDIRVDVLSFSNMISEMHQYIRLWDWGYYKNLNPSRIEWQGESFTSSNFEKFRIARNFRIIRKATSPWTYSTPASNLKIREFFEIPQERIIILAIMSSLDEQFAARVSNIIPETFASTKVFKNQEDWIHNLAEFLKTFKNVVLVVRPHPREVSNKREKILAEIVKSRSEFFANLPQGVIVDYPELGVPIESYFAEVVGVTTGWSSVGIDWQMRGKMCVSYDAALPLYPPGTHLSGNTKEDYFANIEKVIKGLVNNSDYYTGNALSWYVFSNFKGTARLGSSILNEVYLSEILRKTKFLSLITRFFPKFRLWLDLHSISLFPNKKKILEYFSSSKKSFLSNI
jgi:hypothetical protein